ncbi:hypothetical protein NXS19_007500 [Fusarium pseudograminearum]|nr:hypothetical protein NXS19_007500 [Fusarium pseudograminearum]
MEAEGWTKTCETAKPNVEDEPAVIEVRKLRAEMEELKSMLSQLGKTTAKGSDDNTITGSNAGKAPETGDDAQEVSETTETADVLDTSDTPEAEATSGDNKSGKKGKKKNNKKKGGSSS